MKLIIAGSRGIVDYDKVKTLIDSFRNYLIDVWPYKVIREVVSGTARGVDELGERWARENNLLVKKFPADWDQHGKKAGYIRNVAMAEYADIALVLWDGKSKGAEHMINIAREHKLPLRVYKK